MEDLQHALDDLFPPSTSTPPPTHTHTLTSSVRPPTTAFTFLQLVLATLQTHY